LKRPEGVTLQQPVPVNSNQRCFAVALEPPIGRIGSRLRRRVSIDAVLHVVDRIYHLVGASAGGIAHARTRYFDGSERRLMIRTWYRDEGAASYDGEEGLIATGDDRAAG